MIATPFRTSAGPGRLVLQKPLLALWMGLACATPAFAATPTADDGSYPTTLIGVRPSAPEVNGLNSSAAAHAAAPDSLAIHTGVVVIDGRLLSSPYAVRQDGDLVSINGVVLGTIRRPPGAWRRNLFESGEGGSAAVALVERTLLQDGTILRLAPETVLLLGDGSGLDVLNVLCRDAGVEEKVAELQMLECSGTEHLSTGRWGTLIAGFSPDDDLRAFLADYFGDFEDDDADANANGAADPARTISSVRFGTSMLYGAQVLGMVVGVFALGNLLSLRPPRRVRWREFNPTDDAVSGVRHCLMLLGALAVFDLICTLAAWHTGMFRELNPLASQVAQGPLTIVALKVVATGTAVALLFRLRHYAGAQLASWWMCFVCTLVTFRWVTYHSMFLE